jgi:hypothetical protein
MAADLSKIERTITKEPKYQSKPKYCLLIFRPEAKTRVWLVLDGDILYVDRNDNGDLTEEGERILMASFDKERHPLLCKEWRQVKVGNIRDGGLTHTDLMITQMRWDSPVAGMWVHGLQRLNMSNFTTAIFRQVPKASSTRLRCSLSCRQLLIQRNTR